MSQSTSDVSQDQDLPELTTACIEHQIARIVQALSVVHAFVYDRNLGQKIPQWCFLDKAYFEPGTGFLYLYYYTRNSETTPSESYPVAAAPVVNHYASFKLSLPSRRKLDWPYQYYVEKLIVWANAMHKISSTRTSFITRSFLPLSEAELVRISGFNMTEYVEYCRQYGMFA
ncbi:hypothetical protein CPB85DRAFT_1291564 [Mucidula mucida]|nr:hypothetical protein CPB85DRAFT_1291564 [Mucidula mucida]